MLHDASGPTWRQTCYVPSTGPHLDDQEAALAVLGRFASTGGFRFRQTPWCTAFHLVHAGTGTVRAAGRSWQAGPGSVFCFAPGVPVEYEDHRGRPWRYTWVNLVGRRAVALASTIGGGDGPWARDDLPVQAAATLLDEVEAAYRSEEYSPFYPVAAAWRFLDALAGRPAGRDRSQSMASAVRRIIDAQFALPLKIGSLAKQLNVDRSTLFRQFQALYGATPKTYLDRVRLDHGAALLRDGSVPVARAAELCGYPNPQRFAKAFAQRFGSAPSRWRRS